MAASMRTCENQGRDWSDSDIDDDDAYPGLDDDSGDEMVSTCAPSSCLFCEQVHSNGEKNIRHIEEEHNVPLSDMFRDVDAVTFYSFIKLVNFFRRDKAKASEFTTVSSLTELISRLDDGYMIPGNPDDGLLQFDFDTYQEKLRRTQPPSVAHMKVGCNGSSADDSTLTLSRAEYESLVTKSSLCERLKRELSDLHERYNEDISQLRESAQRVLQTTVVSTSEMKAVHTDSPSGDKNSSQVHSLKSSEDEGYISSYSHYSIHMEMLQDFVRTDSYRQSIESNSECLFRDKVVLDVGCGTGILSMFAARAGAKHVIAVDMSDVIYQAMDIVRENGLNEKITLIKGRIEEISLPDGIDGIDVIISEWMGYFLLFESMLDSVIYAREKWLRPNGIVWPNRCDILLTASSDVSLYNKYIKYWDDVYGLKMSCMRGEVCKEALVQIVNSQHIVCQPHVIKTVDCCKDSVSDLDFTSDFTLCVDKDCAIYALIGYFDTVFDAQRDNSTKVTFSTGPLAKSTHWKQTVFLLPKPLNKVKGEQVSGTIDVRKHPKDPRSIQVKIKMDSLILNYTLC